MISLVIMSFPFMTSPLTVTRHLISHSFVCSIYWGFIALGLMLSPAWTLANEVRSTESEGDRVIRELRDTTILPLVQELGLVDVRLGDINQNAAHWFFGIDTVFWVDGRHDAVSWNTGSRTRSMQQAVGVNQGAFASMRQGKLYTLGGAGIYREHANLFVFNVLKGWELLNVRGNEPEAVSARRVVIRDDRTWQVLGISVPRRESDSEELNERSVMELDLVRMEWNLVGELNQDLARRLGDFRVYPVHSGYAALFGVATGGIYECASGQFAELPEFTLSHVPQCDAHGSKDGELFWLFKVGPSEWEADRLHLKSLFDASAKVSLFQGDVEGFSSKATLLAVFVGALFAAIAGGLHWKRRNASPLSEGPVPLEPSAVGQRMDPRISSVSASTEDDDDRADWELILRFMKQSTRLMNAQEMNNMLGIGPNVSDDSQRSRRARSIRRMNQAFERQYGRPFVTRERDANDRRHLLYKIDDFPERTA